MALSREKTIEVLHQTGLYTPTKWVYRRSEAAYWLSHDLVTKRSEQTFLDYIGSNQKHKLHIGCGGNYLEGWFNTDVMPNTRRARLDATRRFPYPDNSFDFIFTEHMIEHVPYRKGQTMLKQCFRVLKPGGVLRVVTPDLRFLINMYQDPENEMHSSYIKWAGELFIGKKAPHDPVTIVNNFFRDWGHQYIYDVPSMKASLRNAGFKEIAEAALNDSSHTELRGLEHDQRMPEGFLALESMILEATKTG